MLQNGCQLCPGATTHTCSLQMPGLRNQIPDQREELLMKGTVEADAADMAANFAKGYDSHMLSSAQA
eukprot:gene3960-14039_t